MGLHTTRQAVLIKSLWSGGTGFALGAGISVIVNNALIEISLTPFCERNGTTNHFQTLVTGRPLPPVPPFAAVAAIFGLVLLLLGALMIWRKLWEQHENSLTRILVLAFSTLVLLSGFSCFLLEVCCW